MISLIAGLGNVGEKYAGSRHNLGFNVLDIIAEKWKKKRQPGSGDYFYIERIIDTRPVRLIWPTTYMNNSGKAVEQAVKHFQVPTDQILIVCDDFNLPLGKIRIRRGGADGGHNGLASVIYSLETEKIPRLRMGIGPIPEGVDSIDFVLERLSKKECEIIQKTLEKSAEAVLYSLRYRLDKAMSEYNNDNPAPDTA